MSRLLFLALFAAFGTAVLGESVQERYEAVVRNAKFQTNLATVVMKTQLTDALNYEKNYNKANSDEFQCMKGIKDDAEKEGLGIVNFTVGQILPALDKLQKDADAGQWDVVEKYLNTIDYPVYKKNAMEEFRAKIKSWFPKVQDKMEGCKASEE